jgi:hypothetical protein
MFAGFDDELTVVTKLALAAAQSVLVERRNREVAMHGARSGEPQLLEVRAKTGVDRGERQNGRGTSRYRRFSANAFCEPARDGLAV